MPIEQPPRMGGGDKPMRKIRGITILEHVVRRLSDQCDGIVLNANGDPSRFGSLGFSVVEDNVTGTPGPLARVLAALVAQLMSDSLVRRFGSSQVSEFHLF